MREASVLLSCEVIDFHCLLLLCMVALWASVLFCKTLSLKVYMEDFSSNAFSLLKVRAFLFSICVSHLIHKFVLLL